MNELVQLVMQKTGLSQDKSQEVVDAVVNHFKSRLPQSVTGHFSALLGKTDSSGAQDLWSKAKSAFTGVGNKEGGEAS